MGSSFSSYCLEILYKKFITIYNHVVEKFNKTRLEV